MARERGFTLFEVLVALVIGALVAAIAHQLFNNIVEGTQRLAAARITLDRAANARRWLTATFLSVDVATDGAGTFEGLGDRATFSAWALTADGWFVRRRVTIAREESRLVAILTPGEAIQLADSVSAIAFDYLLEPGADARWSQEWVSPLKAPLAVRLRVQRGGAVLREGALDTVDTLLFLVKERG